ncbi:unnamed protein product [Durusdinium trenchii]|uniref:Uncharacterized protein n=1 Tax=Durusdinium trenchii TaxID=1381693 RepID=A0ABP0NCI0_9DINO
MPLQRRREGRPSGGQSSSGAAKPTASPPGGDEVRQINRELQRLDDVIRPLEDILENPPSSETAELVDIYLSEAQKKVEELQLHADFCVEQGHFDVFQRIADCKSNFDELSVRANSWKEAASHQEARSSPLGAAPRGAAPAASPQASASPARSEDHLPDLEPLEAPQASDPSPQAAQPSPGSFQQSMRSQASAVDPTPGAAGGAYQSPGSVQQSMRSQASAADPTPGAFGGAQPSPGAAFSSMKSQASAVAPGSVRTAGRSNSWFWRSRLHSDRLGTGSTWPSPSGPSWSEWIWPAQPPTPEAAVTLPLDKSKSTPSSRKKLLNQDGRAAKWRLQDALKMSKQDPHMLSSALHDAKDNNLEQTAPELVRQAEDALQEAQMASQRSAAERELDTAVATLSADLNTKDVDTGRLSQHTQLLQRAIEDATAAGLQTSQATARRTRGRGRSKLFAKVSSYSYAPGAGTRRACTAFSFTLERFWCRGQRDRCALASLSCTFSPAAS